MKPSTPVAAVTLFCAEIMSSAQPGMQCFGKLDATLTQDRTFTAYYVRAYRPGPAAEKAEPPVPLGREHLDRHPG